MSRKGIRQYIQQEYKIIDEYQNIYSIKSLCEYMSVSRSGYYKWKYLTRPFEVIVSDMTAFKVKGIYYELTMYFSAWNKEIAGYMDQYLVKAILDYIMMV